MTTFEVANSYEFQLLTGFLVAQELHADNATLTRFDVVRKTKDALYLRGEPAPTGAEIAGMAHYFDTLED